MYQITLNKKQAELVCEALNVLSRLGSGQWRDAIGHLPIDNIQPGWFDDLDAIGCILKKYTINHVDGWRSSLGIFQTETPTEAKMCWDMYQVIRNRLSWDRAVADGVVESLSSPRKWPEMMGVSYDEPMFASEEPFIRIEGVE